jgi:hypothetical protein
MTEVADAGQYGAYTIRAGICNGQHGGYNRIHQEENEKKLKLKLKAE